MGISPDINDDIIRLFFESKKRSGGGEIIYLNREIDDGKAIIKFKFAAGNI